MKILYYPVCVSSCLYEKVVFFYECLYFLSAICLFFFRFLLLSFFLSCFLSLSLSFFVSFFRGLLIPPEPVGRSHFLQKQTRNRGVSWVWASKKWERPTGYGGINKPYWSAKGPFGNVNLIDFCNWEWMSLNAYGFPFISGRCFWIFLYFPWATVLRAGYLRLPFAEASRKPVVDTRGRLYSLPSHRSKSAAVSAGFRIRSMKAFQEEPISARKSGRIRSKSSFGVWGGPTSHFCC